MQVLTKGDLESFGYLKEYDYNGEYIRTLVLRDGKIVDSVTTQRFSLSGYLKKKGYVVAENEERHLNILRLAMVFDVEFPVVYTLTSPDVHSYCIPARYTEFIEDSFCKKVTSNSWYWGLSKVLYKYLLTNHPDFDYESLLARVKECILSGDYMYNNVDGGTHRGQPSMDESLQNLKRDLRAGRPVKREDYVKIQKHFETILKEYVKFEY